MDQKEVFSLSEDEVKDGWYILGAAKRAETLSRSEAGKAAWARRKAAEAQA